MVSTYYVIGSLIMLVQCLCIAMVYANSRYALKKYKRNRSYRPKTVLIVPCKGLDLDFDKNISSLIAQDFNNYLLWFVVESKNDPAYKRLCELRENLCGESQALEIKIHVAGIGSMASQKIHNMLYCCGQIDDDVEVLAFADSDICVRKDWLSHLVYPLRQEKIGVSTGYRWFVPLKNNLATLALSAGNAKVAQLLGNSLFNQAWGGSMAVRRKTYDELNIEQLWSSAVSDDLSLSETAKRAGYKVAYVPACLAASHESTNWTGAFEFVRRQFMITKVFSPGTWWFSIITMTGALVAAWGPLCIAILAVIQQWPNLWFYILIPVVNIFAQFSRAAIRQYTILKLLREEAHNLRYAVLADLFLFWLWSIMLCVLIMSTAFGRTIFWRGVRYKMVSPTETVVVRE